MKWRRFSGSGHFRVDPLIHMKLSSAPDNNSPQRQTLLDRYFRPCSLRHCQVFVEKGSCVFDLFSPLPAGGPLQDGPHGALLPGGFALEGRSPAAAWQENTPDACARGASWNSFLHCRSHLRCPGSANRLLSCFWVRAKGRQDLKRLQLANGRSCRRSCTLCRAGGHLGNTSDESSSGNTRFGKPVLLDGLLRDDSVVTPSSR